MNLPLDITLVAGARPDLLQSTLNSFQSNVFQNFLIRNVYVNIDPIFGGEDERRDCVAIVRDFFPNACLSLPESGSFGRAVKHLWSSTDDAHVLHLEDDWIVNDAVLPENVFPYFDDTTGMITPSPDPKQKVGGDFAYITRRKRILGFEVFRKQVNAYGTSPRFFRPGLAKKFGNLLKAKYDPEKQVYKNKNWPLAWAHQPWKCRMLFTRDGQPLITDIGRPWREMRAIRKVDHGGYATWVQEKK